MVQGSMLVVILIAAIVLMVVLISAFKFHPFLSLFAVALLMGLAVGMAPADVLNTMLNLNTAYKAQTMATLVEGAVGVLVVYGLSIYML